LVDAVTAIHRRWRSDRISPGMTRLLMLECAERDKISANKSSEGDRLCQQY
jgi:hypothetical protein